MVLVTHYLLRAIIFKIATAKPDEPGGVLRSF